MVFYADDILVMCTVYVCGYKKFAKRFAKSKCTQKLSVLQYTDI